MAGFIYSMIRARKAVGDKVILDDVTMSFYPGAKIGMVGPNGAGKSTILKIMAGLDQPSNGEAKLTPGYSVGILMQEPVLDETKPVLENLQEAIDAADAWDLDSQLDQAMDALRCPPGDEQVSVLSGGEKRRVALCKL